MAKKTILEQILSNTEEVKEVVVTKENERQQLEDAKKEKRKQQNIESQKGFQQIKANVKHELYEKIKARCENGNISGYLKKLISDDLNKTPSLFESQEDKKDNKEELVKEVNLLRSEIKTLKSMSFIQKVRWLFR